MTTATATRTRKSNPRKVSPAKKTPAKQAAKKASATTKPAEAKPVESDQPKPVVDEHRAQELSTRLVALRVDDGFSRAQLAELTSLTQAKIWRLENSRFKDAAEADAIASLLDGVDAGKIQRPERSRKSTVAKAELLKVICEGADADDERRAILFGQLVDMITPIDLTRPTTK